ncbi:hypothetical protein OS493_009292 [Desmophyllum pertusum]|uniref:Uncharacterized protein n=1 Tax=Desmophyllum pertusum TaxID=174260 RepID=A0A9X0CUI2_9CNID|nr:hypothetical protein OS493_009292 [Desmophyllum pertusum]
MDEMVILTPSETKTPHRSALPSAYNNWSPWAWDWWLHQEQHDVIKKEKTAQDETSKTADNKQATINQSPKKT